MRGAVFGPALLVLALSPAALPAQVATSDLVKMRPANPEDDIIVEARPIPRPEDVKKQARQLTRMDNYYSSPLAQFQQRVCPGIIGLPVDMAEYFVDRIRFNAERLGMRTAKLGKCQPNIVIAFVLNGRMEVDALARTRSYVFSNIATWELDAMLADTGPVHAWNSTQAMTRDGMPVGAGADVTGRPPVVQVPSADSHISFATRLDIAQSVVLIDVAAIDGMSVVQLADYATMRAFARTLPARGDMAASTILSLFDKSAPAPRELTPFDLGYLRGIYRSQGNLPASAKLGAIPREVKRVLASAAETPDAP